MNNFKNARKLKKEDLKNIVGGGLDTSINIGNPDLSQCGCSCSGSVTGPWYCAQYFGCPQVYTCNQSAV